MENLDAKPIEKTSQVLEQVQQLNESLNSLEDSSNVIILDLLRRLEV